MRVVFAGTPEVALPTLNAIAGSRHEIVAVVTRPDAPSGRGRRLTPSPVALRAEELGIEILKPEHPRDEAFQARLRELDPDCCPVVAYGALLPQSALDIPRLGWVNLHFSLLPEYRGAAPVQRAVWNGEEFSGATTFQIVKELDAGPTFGVMTQLLAPDETAGSLFDKLADGGAGLMVATLDALEDDRIEARPQPVEGITYAPKIAVEDARIDWTRAAVALDHQIRACTPAPGAWTLLDGERFKVGPATVVDGELKPGEIEVRKNDVLVGTGSQCLRLGMVKAFGKKDMPAGDWARGVRLESGASFDA
ncbi:methionyl-tRNA formyltransferase [Nocardioides baekrokdamisoli]|uniref:Methionyl-tRNA formyltransferase n=1 Tax=Nocardioides baekrokdamisoli TaxID=1804624 RepID=A0A3G9IBN5_9ACTN|nr:methionyl-tRNA formyltransferase [Nocardioides baekrokdamisoli]BBH16277.1 methionyl-tRNA formyltransferase [Nocardioides baekrokdamisoli]